MSFELTTVGEYATIQGGYAYKSQDFQLNSQWPVLKIKNIRKGYISYDDTSFVLNEIAFSTKNWMTREGDILISMTGSGPSAPESLVGRVARVWENEPPALINQRVGRLVLKDYKKIDPDFLFYVLSSSGCQDYLVSNSTGSANQVNISSKVIESVECPRINFDISKEIAEILKTLDKRIRVLVSTNKTLEAIAQALFKSWFVDFDPVHAKAEGRAPEGIDVKTATFFPDSFEKSKLGLVPKGWNVGVVANLGEVICGKTPPTSNKENYGNDVPFITIPDMHGALAVTAFTRKLSNQGANTQKNKYLRAGSICVSCIATAGLVVRVTEKAQTNQQINSVVPEEKWGDSFPLFTLRRIGDQVRAGGAGGSVFHNLSKRRFEQISVLLPEVKLAKAYDKLVNPLIEQIVSNQKTAEILSSIRDALLPRLISGQLRLSESKEKIGMTS